MSGSNAASHIAGEPVRIPGAVNAHSHVFHRALRGRTHRGGGDFWQWREQMYQLAAALDPESYEQLATAVFAEMATAGYTTVGEFHYLHHQPDGSPYPEHAMEFALARAAQRVGIRLVLLDVCYLDGGFDAQRPGGRVPPDDVQRRFSDGDAETWLARLDALRTAFAAEFGAQTPDSLIRVGAAVHSVRAVAPEQLRFIAENLTPELPLHVHLSEQPKENRDCLAATGLKPTGLLAETGLLSDRLAAVHATHLSPEDISLLGQAGSSAVFCPTTEADLADGLGPATELVQAGATLALGSDQHAVIDPFQEIRSLEYGERLRSGERGRFSPEQLGEILSAGGARSLGLDSRNLAADEVLLDTASMRTEGSSADQILYSATAADVLSVRVAGREIAGSGRHLTLGDPAELFRKAAEVIAKQGGSA